MANSDQIFKDFFTYVIGFLKDWSLCFIETKDVLKALNNLSEQLTSVYSSSWNQSLLKKFPDIKDRLHHKILSGLEEERNKLNDSWHRLSLLKDELQSKFDLIERNIRTQCLASFTSYGMIVPPLYRLVEYAEDITRHYSILFIQLTSALTMMDFQNHESVLNMEKIYQRSAAVPDKIKDALSCTKHLISVPFSLEQLGKTSDLQSTK
ncbi:AFG2-interacting ribosome maturation factor [Halyomorpha halys]|uniref:AFG2-interacting ribosome maturation factor n=1 Tax=Halyomorpha halys TaxID=286706 RepID=UPI0006D525DD|nr:uncharacterized protein LOC106691604 [Halyomorpha halys]